MKKVKTALWIIVLILVVLFIVQNQEFLSQKQVLTINVYIMAPYQTPELPTAVLIIACFLIGYLLSYFCSLSQRFKSKKKIKTLIGVVNAQKEKITALEGETRSTTDPAADEEKEPVETQTEEKEGGTQPES
jgi:uncharacterized integral membrane protein